MEIRVGHDDFGGGRRTDYWPLAMVGEIFVRCLHASTLLRGENVGKKYS